MFQFQTGAIKSMEKYVRCLRAAKFQFQTGAIKRVDGLAIFRPEGSFNSKLVRLKAKPFLPN